MADIVRDRFIHKVLKEEGEKLLSSQTLVIGAKLESHTGALLNNRSAKAYGGNGDFEGVLVFEHPVYERFLDMPHLGGREKGTKRKIHNRPILQTYNRVAARLMTEFTDAVQAQLRDEITDIRRKLMGNP